jgi:dynein heavy chain
LRTSVFFPSLADVHGLTVPLCARSLRSNKGNVEKWLLELQSSMRITIKDVVIKSMESYPTTKRPKWVLDWPAQCVLNVSQMYWTREVEAAMRAKGARGVREYLETCNNQLQDLVKLVRGGLTKMQRTTLGALCVIDVHARDVVQELVHKEVRVCARVVV